tara:strand:- start:351 stop:731 length:381 start_codon:yes stop_codon:yes gene_type:complete
MIEFEIIQKIKVKTLSEDVIRKILIKEIQKQIPEAYVNGIEFVVKRNPTRVELEVDADYSTSNSTTIDSLNISKANPLGVVKETKEKVLNDMLSVPKSEPAVEMGNPAISDEALKASNDVADMFKL